MIRTFEFAGELADTFTHEPLRFDADDWSTAFSAFTCVYPDFKAKLREFDDLAIIKRKGDTVTCISEEELPMTFGNADTIVLAAGTRGSGPAAVAWVAEAIEAYGVSAAVATTIAYVAVNIAIAYAASMVMRALGGNGPDPTQKSTEKHASYLYNGAQNVVDQGGAIPLIYGRHRVGGTVISTEISTERVAQLMPDTITAQLGQTTTYNLLSNDIMRDYLSITSWSINGSAQTLGGTYTDPNYTVSVAADGTVTVTCTVAGPAVTFNYTASDSSSNTTPSSTATIQFNDPQAANYTSGGGGDAS